MTREEIERFVRTVIFMESPTAEGVGEMTNKITERWIEDRADAHQDGVLAGQMSVWNNSSY